MASTRQSTRLAVHALNSAVHRFAIEQTKAGAATYVRTMKLISGLAGRLNARRFLFLAVALAFAIPASHAASAHVTAVPALPAYGQAVQIEVTNPAFPVYLRTMRYAKTGYAITIDYDYVIDGFGPARPDLGAASMALGELAPGNYALSLRFFDMSDPQARPQVVTTNLPILPPGDWGIYAVPQQPGAFEPIDVVVRSAAYYDPTTMRASVSGNVVRVDFDYYSDAPTMGSTVPAGATSYGAVRIAGLAPGSYRIEGWGRPKNGGNSEKYFTRDASIGTVSPVVEYYAESLDHYFVSASPDEIASLDTGAQPGWERTGQRFKAWLRAQDAPMGAAPVCRFYARGPNSHFYTINASECQFLRNLEPSQRADAARQGVAFTGWQYEGIAFYSIPPQQGQCPGGTDPVHRAYNLGGAGNDSNHRLTIDGVQHAMMLLVWADEGVAFCSPR